MLEEIKACRICGNKNLVNVLDLGRLSLTGKFPRSKSERVKVAPLEVVKCFGDGEVCGLLQLRHTGDVADFYGPDYGYRSGLNVSMSRHLHQKVQQILRRVSLSTNDLVIDIGSSDGTLLEAYPKNLTLVGIDPCGEHLRRYYARHIQLIPEFFSAQTLRQSVGEKKASVITSIAMFYDLQEPISFMQQVYDILAEDGLWVLEQSYLPTMLKMNSYDTICHEHLEYYTLKQIKWMTDRVGFKILDVEFNDVNGGSFLITVAKQKSSHLAAKGEVEKILSQEQRLGIDTLRPYQEFKRRILVLRDSLKEFLSRAKEDGRCILGYGASTKGNVVLQFCNISEDKLPYIADVNEDKIGCFTPGTHIPIISEQDARKRNPDYFMVLPWHFRDAITRKESAYMRTGGKLLFPLPSMDVVAHN